MMVTVEESKVLICPLMSTVSTFQNCRGAGCMAWRWKDHATDPTWVAAVRQAAEDIKDTSPSRTKAAAHVRKNRAQYGLAEFPERGWCGLAGKPEWWPK